MIKEYETVCLRRSGEDMEGIGGGRRKGRANIVLIYKISKKNILSKFY